MKNMTRRSLALAAMAALGLAVSACGSQAEKQAEVKADAMEDAADLKDNKLDGVDSKAEQALEDKAADVRAKGEAKADAIEDKADAVRAAADKK